jgi:hypothetical protein
MDYEIEGVKYTTRNMTVGEKRNYIKAIMGFKKRIGQDDVDAAIELNDYRLSNLVLLSTPKIENLDDMDSRVIDGLLYKLDLEINGLTDDEKKN